MASNTNHKARSFSSFKTQLVHKVFIASIISWLLFLIFFAFNLENNYQENRAVRQSDIEYYLSTLLTDTSNLVKTTSKHISRLVFQEKTPFEMSNEERDQRLNDIWKTLDLTFTNRIEMRHYNTRGELLNLWNGSHKLLVHGSRLPDSLLERALSSPKGINIISCSDYCYISHVRSLALHTNSSGLLQLSLSADRFVQQLKNTHGSDVYILNPNNSINPDLLLDGKPYTLDSATSATRYSQVIRQRTNFQSTEHAELPINNTSYELQFIATPQSHIQPEFQDSLPYFIFATDITLDRQHFENFIVNVLLGSVLIMLITLCITYYLLSKPLNNLIHISKTFPLMGRGDFQQAHADLQEVSFQKNQHELSHIHNAAVELTQQLEDLHTEIEHKNLYLAQTLEERSAERNYFHSLLDTAEAMMLTCDEDHRITMCNKYALDHLNKTLHEVLGHSFVELFISPDASEDEKSYSLPTRKPQVVKYELPFTKASGESRLFSWTHNTVTKPNGECSIFSIGIDISSRWEYENHIQHLANHDFLTSLYNRRYFSKSLADLVKESETITLIYVDINHFKLVNDIQGHAVGDQLLISITQILQTHCPDGTLIGRIGGDEFGIAIANRSREFIKELAETIIHQIAQLNIFTSGEAIRKISASIGIACYPEDANTLDKLAAYADAAMYENKRTRSGSYHFYNGDEVMLRRVRESKRWNDIVRDALNKDRIRAYFQPVVKTEGMTISHYEVLARLVDENDEPLYTPAHFIEFVEKSQLIVQFDHHIIDQALKQAHKLTEFPTLMINLSNVTISTEGTIEYILERILHYQYPTDKIVFEITETSAIDDIEQANSFINRLREEGIRFALDDFGTGYSSLSYLKQLPVDFLKIDRSLVQGLLSDAKAPEVLKSIVLLTRSYNMKVIAEGIEQSEFIDLIKELGIDYMQGFYFSQAQQHIPETINQPAIRSDKPTPTPAIASET